MKTYVLGGMMGLFLLMGALVPSANAETTTDVSSMLEQIKALMAKVEELKKQLATVQGQIKDVIRDGVEEGMTGEDIREVQKLLATDPSIYPQGLVTGYFGPLTKEAIKRLQERHELKVTGVIDEDTHDLLEEYLKERFGDDVPPGLLRAPGIAKKIELRIKDGCDNSKGAVKALFCKKLKVKYGDDDEDEDEDENDDGDDIFHVEVELEDDEAKVKFKFEGDKYELEVSTTTLSAILEEVADALDVDVEDIDEDLKDAIEEAYDDEVEENEDEDEDNDAKEKAEDAIEEAEDAIEDADEAIDEADGDTSDAEELLAKAEAKLELAKDALEDDEYATAKSYAERAEDYAKDAKDLAD